MWVAVRTGLPGTWCPGVHANCIHNEIAALRLRSLAQLPMGPDPCLSSGVEAAYRALGVLASRYRGVPWSHLETARSYSGAMQRRYLEAERSLREDGPLGKKDRHLKAFLKAEKLGAGKDPKPRMIFPRSPRFNLCVARFLKPFEHWLWGFLTARRLFGGSNTRVVGKGLSPRRRANLIRRKFEGFVDPVCFEVDGKAFEAHVVESHLVRERRVYKKAYPGNRELASLLESQVFKGTTQNGVKFSRRGGRASGDFNTGMGNTLIMLAVVVGVLRCYGIKFDVLVDGDNALLFLERVDLPGVLASFYQDVLEASGFEMTLESPVDYVEGVRFGRSAPVFIGPHWTMVREPWSVLSGAFASHRWLREPSFGKRWLHGVARCELSLAIGVPILQTFALTVLERTRGGKEVSADTLADYFAVGARLAGSDEVVDIRGDARLSFERAFGISIREQLLWEKKLQQLEVGFAPKPITMLPFSRWEDAEPGLYEAYVDAHF